MKVNVLQVEYAKFRSKLRWWSNWVDIAVFQYDMEGYLLQMRVSRTNKKAFRHVAMKSSISMNSAYIRLDMVGDLTQSVRPEEDNDE